MTVSTTLTKAAYAGNGVTTSFAFPFRVLDVTHLSVVLTDALGASVVQILTTNYTVPATAIGVEGGGAVTMLVAPPVGTTLTLLRTVPATQATDFANQGQFYPESHETALDKLTMLVQQLTEAVGRTLRGSFLGGPIAEIGTAVARAGKYLGFDSNGDPFLTTGTGAATDSVLVSFIQSFAGSITRTALDKLRERVTIEDFTGCDPGGVALSDQAFAAAALTGRAIRLTADATYYLSQRVTMQNGSKFICDGRCTIKCKTGAGGFNNTDLSVKSTQAVFWFSLVDDNALEGIDFTTDGVKEVTIYPIRTSGGFSTKGIDIRRITVTGFSGLNGGYLSINSCGAGAYRIRDYEVKNCGTAQGNTYWSGFMQITALEIDNDLLGGVASEPGYAENIRVTNLLLTGQALTDYSQQTDAVNVAGGSTTARKGPVINGLVVNGVGEVCDLFCNGAQIRGVRAQNVKLFAAKFIHGAQYNYVECDFLENVGLVACLFNGSTSAAQDTVGNTCVIHNLKGVGSPGGGDPDTSSGSAPSACAFYGYEVTGTARKPRNNLCVIHNMDVYAAQWAAVRDNSPSDVGAGNRCEIHRFSGAAFVSRFCDIGFANNGRAFYLARKAVVLRQAAANVTATASVNTTAQFDTVVYDPDALSVPASFKITFKYPGTYLVKAQVRMAANATATDRVAVKLTRAGATTRQSTKAYGQTLEETTFDCSATVQILESEIGTTSADYAVLVQQTGTSNGSIMGTTNLSYFEAAPIPG